LNDDVNYGMSAECW